jgi:type IV pilus assembly protein PilA
MKVIFATQLSILRYSKVIKFFCMICHEPLAISFMSAIIDSSDIHNVLRFYIFTEAVHVVWSRRGASPKTKHQEENGMKKGSKKSKKGFTLIELVVVIAILGILAAILVPVISGFIETANQATDNANARLVYQSAAMWFAANNPTAASTSLTGAMLSLYMGTSTLPSGKSTAFSGACTASVTNAGEITVQFGSHTYNPATGKLS